MGGNLVSKSEFKEKALEFFRQVEASGERVIVTDHGKPVLEVRPYRGIERRPLEVLRDSVVRYDNPTDSVAEDERSTEVLFYGPSDKPLSHAARAAADKLFAAASVLLPEGAENLFGAWCIADLDLALMLNRLVLNGDTVPQRLADYATQQWQRPSVRPWLELTRPPL